MNRAMISALMTIAVAITTAYGSPMIGQLGNRGPAWTSPNHFRILLEATSVERRRSHAPAAVEVYFQRNLRDCGASGGFDENTVEVVALSSSLAGQRVPCRIDRLYGADKVILTFIVPAHTCTNFAVYFDTLESALGKPKRTAGLVGDGDFLRERFQRREIGCSHFDCFADLDGDGDLDLFKGGVEPYVRCYENVGINRFVDRGRLASGGAWFKLPCSRANRSWVTVAFYDLDQDGAPDFLPSFGDGPEAGRILYYRNTSREHGGQLTFTRVGALQTTSGLPLAGGAQAGGWFPTITFVNDWDGDGLGPDALVGSNSRCWLYRGLGTNADGSPRFAEAVAVLAGGQPIELTNPRFEVADIDRDGDFDLFAGTQPGPVYWFQNTGFRTNPLLTAGKVIAWDGKYLIGDLHSGVMMADFDGDGLLDLVSGRFWERADLRAPASPRRYGGCFKNIGGRTTPRFEWRARGGPYTEQFQLCDAVRQNSVRAVDWNNDGNLDLLAGDTDGFIWFFRNEGDAQFPVFTPGQKLTVAGEILSVAATGGHARLAICDWNNDGAQDLVVADGAGSVTLFLNQGRKTWPQLRAGVRLQAGGRPIQLRSRASVVACDWNNDGRKDLLLADEKGYYVCLNQRTDAQPELAAPKPVLFGGRQVSYARPNLGAFLDWDGDGQRDLIGCHFENSVRFYRNLGSGAPGTEPVLADPEGEVILLGESPQMISGADVLDWNGDGDLDLLTGQGHGGSGLRFYERDWLENERQGAHPKARILSLERKSGASVHVVPQSQK